jgi:hypothetical protein
MAGSPFEYSSKNRQAMRELLIRYLLGELDAEERREVQSRLQSSPELRCELAQLRSCFAANQEEDLCAPEPPNGLAARTAGRVTSCGESSDVLAARHGAAFAPSGDPPAGILGWSLADLAVAGGVMLAVSMLLFPALRNSRDGTRRTVCANHQRQLWVLVTSYAQDHGNLYPKVGPNENAGIYVRRLIEGGYIRPADLALLLVCPGSPLADEIRAGRLTIRLPSAEAIRAMTPGQLARATATMSPFYNYRFPYRVGHHLHYIKDERQPLSPVFSDTAGDAASGQISPNHGGSIVQVQFEDGSLRTLTTRKLPGLEDDMFVNDRGVVAAGLSSQDSVLGRSNATPGAESAAQSR